MSKAVYPGQFDPVTNGHLDIIDRARKLVDHLVVAVVDKPQRNTTFTTDERVELLRQSLGDRPGVEVKAFHGLLVHFVKAEEASLIIRGLRALSDFEMEFQFALMNKSLDEEIETIFLASRSDSTFISSSGIKQVVRFHGDVRGLVPLPVEKALQQRFHGEG